jgi:hypothetical protein
MIEVRFNLPTLLVVLLVAYLLLGVIPFTPIENDSVRLALGIQNRAIYGDQAYVYRYVSQPGTYQLGGFAHRAGLLPPFETVSIITLMASAVFIASTTFFLKRVTGVSAIISFVGTIIFQESFVSAYYPNSSMIAVAFLSAALLLVTYRENAVLVLLSGVLFAFSFWARFDAILIGFSFILLLFERNGRFLKNLFSFGIASSLTAITLLWMSDISVLLIVAESSLILGAHDIGGTLDTYTTIFTLPALLLLGVGLHRMLTLKHYQLALVVLTPLPLILRYGFNAISPKYLLYSVVFLAVPVCFGLERLRPPRTKREQLLLWGTIALAIMQFLLIPPYDLFLKRNIVVHTADHTRLRGIIAYTPAYWHQQKMSAATDYADLETILEEQIEQPGPAYILSHDWMANNWVLYFLQEQGFRIKEQADFATDPELGQRLLLTASQSSPQLP